MKMRVKTSKSLSKFWNSDSICICTTRRFQCNFRTDTWVLYFFRVDYSFSFEMFDWRSFLELFTLRNLTQMCILNEARDLKPNPMANSVIRIPKCKLAFRKVLLVLTPNFEWIRSFFVLIYLNTYPHSTVYYFVDFFSFVFF